MERKTLNQWADDYGIVLIDPDGFDRSNPNLMNELFTKEEFVKGLISCTIMKKL